MQMVCTAILSEMSVCADIFLGSWDPSIRSEGSLQEYKQGEKGQIQSEKEDFYGDVVASPVLCDDHRMGEFGNFGFVSSVHRAPIETGVAS